MGFRSGCGFNSGGVFAGLADSGKQASVGLTDGEELGSSIIGGGGGFALGCDFGFCGSGLYCAIGAPVGFLIGISDGISDGNTAGVVGFEVGGLIAGVLRGFLDGFAVNILGVEVGYVESFAVEVGA